MKVGDVRRQRPLRADALKNRERLVDVARGHVRRNGVSTSLEGIAKEAGVGAGTLYRHFPDRASLLAEVLRAERDALRRAAERVRVAVDAPHRLDAWLREIQVLMAGYRGLAAPVVGALDDQRTTPLSVACRDMVEITGAFLEEARSHGVARDDVTAHDLVACAGMMAWLDAHRPGDPRQQDGVRNILQRGYRQIT